MSLCPKCETRAERPTTHAPMTKEYYGVLIEALRHVAYRHGYALATHGSLGMDIDLIAAPWRDSCTDAHSIAEAVRSTAAAIIGIAESSDTNPTKKPCGRLAWSFHLGPKGCDVPYIDLSVMAKGASEVAEISAKRKKRKSL